MCNKNDNNGSDQNRTGRSSGLPPFNVETEEKKPIRRHGGFWFSMINWAVS
jgi:hypothetical protein